MSASDQTIPLWLRKLPNQLTVARTVVVPFLLLVYPFEIKFLTILCGFLFMFAALTDFFDGFLARQYGLVSKFGSALDPIADKILTAAGLLLLAGTNRLPIFLAGLLLCRDIAISGLRLVAAKEGIDIDVNMLGKFKTTFQSIAVTLLLLHYPLFDLPLQAIGMIFIWISLIISYYSAYIYVTQFWQQYTGRAESN